MGVEAFVRKLGVSTVGAVLLIGSGSSAALAQADHMHDASPRQESTPAQKVKAAALIKAVQDATEPFKDPAVAEGLGYHLQFGCVSGSDSGAMGLHFVNGDLVGDGELDASRPEIILYEPLPNGRMRITGADYLVLAADWDAKHKDQGPPQLMGQLFHLFESPNRFGLPPFYTLHVWAWKDNPNGAFVNWNPNVSCDAFNGQER
jgi:hypothetical protein